MNSGQMKAVLELLGELVLDRFIARVREICNSKNSDIPYFTPHTASHFAGVERAVERLLSTQDSADNGSEANVISKLCPVENLVLRFCCWGHDVGMTRDVNKDFYELQKSPRTPEWSPFWARKHHDEASSYFVTMHMRQISDEILKHYAIVEVARNRDETTNDHIKANHTKLMEHYAARGHSQQLLKLLVDYLAAGENHDSILAHIDGLANSVALIASFHRRQKKIEQCPVHREVLGVTVRAKLLAAVLRLADALHVDRSRFSDKDFERIRYESDFSAEARRHWMKSYLVSAISINTATHSLEVQMDLPEPLDIEEDGSLPSPLVATTGNELDRKRHTIAGMRDFILNDLEEDLLSVSSILLEHSFPPLLRVTNRIHVVPFMGMYSDEILSALDDLNISASPNTSEVMSRSTGQF